MSSLKVRLLTDCVRDADEPLLQQCRRLNWPAVLLLVRAGWELLQNTDQAGNSALWFATLPHTVRAREVQPSYFTILGINFK